MQFGLFDVDDLPRACGMQRDNDRKDLRGSKSDVSDVYEILRSALLWARQATNAKFDVGVIDPFRCNLPCQPKTAEILSD